MTFALPDGQTCGLVLTKYGRLDEYFPQEGGYELQWSALSLNGPGLRFVRHDASSTQPDGTPYPSSIGFDIVNDEGTRMTFCYFENAHSFECRGYRRENSNYDVMIAPFDEATTQLSFYQDGRACGQFHINESNPLLSLTELPGDPETAQKMEMISRDTLATRQEGYTLRWYAHIRGTLDDSTIETAYSKVENGFLTVRWVTYQAGGAIISELTSFPIPLSKEFQQKLETEPFNQLMSLGYSSEFSTDDFLDPSLLPVSGKILQNHLQSEVLLLLTEDETGKRLIEITQDENGVYAIRRSPVLPSDIWLDTFHAGESDLLLDWNQQDHQAGFRRTFNGQWRLELADLLRGKRGFELLLRPEHRHFDGYRYPEDRCAALRPVCGRSDHIALHLRGADRPLDRTGLAVVCNPDPNDRLHLRTKPSREADSLGKFWNGTPVRVLGERDGWCQVEIGTDGRLTGWMLKKYLVTGEKMDQVTPCFSQQILREDEAETKTPIYTDLTLTEQYCTHSSWHLMGVVNDWLYVVVTDEGETGYAPMEWFFDGNG